MQVGTERVVSKSRLLISRERQTKPLPEVYGVLSEAKNLPQRAKLKHFMPLIRVIVSLSVQTVP